MRRRYRRQPDNFAVCGDGRKTDIVNETGKTTGKNNERKKYGKKYPLQNLFGITGNAKTVVQRSGGHEEETVPHIKSRNFKTDYP